MIHAILGGFFGLPPFVIQAHNPLPGLESVEIALAKAFPEERVTPDEEGFRLFMFSECREASPQKRLCHRDVHLTRPPFLQGSEPGVEDLGALGVRSLRLQWIRTKRTPLETKCLRKVGAVSTVPQNRNGLGRKFQRFGM